jgi:bacterial/archaeal transporter family protein
MWKWYALLAAFFAALTAILAKLGVKGIESNLATAIRTAVVLVMIWTIVAASGQLAGLRTLTKTNYLFLILSGIATGLSWIFYFQALQSGPVSKIAPIDKLSVAIVIVLSALILKEPLDAKVIIGGLLIVAGTVVILL